MNLQVATSLKAFNTNTHVWLFVSENNPVISAKKLFIEYLGRFFNDASFEEAFNLQKSHHVLQEKKASWSFPLIGKDIVMSITVQVVKSADLKQRSECFRTVGAQVARHALQVEIVAIAEQRLNMPLAAFVDGVQTGSFEMQQFKAKPKESKDKRLTVMVRGDIRKQQTVLKDALILAKAVSAARYLVDLPAVSCDSKFLLSHAQELAKRAKLQIEVLDAKQLLELGAQGLLTVNQGSDRAPFLIKLKKKGSARGKAGVALVGKGVTFDTGGLCIKNMAGMEHMKKDMAGAAAVLCAMEVIGQSKSSCDVTAYIPIVENSISANSMRPGDIYKSLSGKFVEVINTDAEGRLILLDALTLAEREGATTIVDLATLTGACQAALGDIYGGLFSRDQKLVQKLIAAGEETGDMLWPLPLHAEYAKAIESRLADLRNLATYGPGASTAAHFLEAAFTSKTIRWAHIDMAGTASMTRDVGYRTKGATGFGVRLLAEFIRTL